VATKATGKYLSKKIRFGKQELILYSLDGLTWSSRRSELAAIKERHAQEKVTAAQLKGEVEEEVAAKPQEDGDGDEQVELKADSSYDTADQGRNQQEQKGPAARIRGAKGATAKKDLGIKAKVTSIKEKAAERAAASRKKAALKKIAMDRRMAKAQNRKRKAA
jgi:hypothetical protein